MPTPVESRLAYSKCHSCIESSMEFFTIDQGRVSVIPETSLWTVLSKCFAKFISIWNIDDSHEVLSDTTALERMVDAIFDTDSRAFITQNSLPMLDRLDDQAKACLLAQAIAGVILILRRLTVSGAELSHGLFSKELQLFAESEQRQRMLEMVEGSHAMAACTAHTQLITMFMEAIDDGSNTHHDTLPLTMLGEDLLENGVSWVSDRPCRNMGLPWGFTIMALN